MVKEEGGEGKERAHSSEFNMHERKTLLCSKPGLKQKLTWPRIVHFVKRYVRNFNLDMTFFADTQRFTYVHGPDFQERLTQNRYPVKRTRLFFLAQSRVVHLFVRHDTVSDMSVCPRLRMVGGAGSGRGQKSRTLALSSNHSPTPKNPNFVNVPSLPRRTNTRNPVGHACDGQVGRAPRLSDASRGTVLQNHQLASSISQVITSPVLSGDNARAHPFRSGVRLKLAHGEAVALASPRHRFRAKHRATSPRTPTC